jgi:prepilin-type N-terminal cleavage/methylation domain-containing protein
MSLFKKDKKGFTLIELLISVSVIALLSGITFTVINPQGLRSKSRDKQRIADLKRVQAALEMYHADNRRYPLQGSFGSLPSSLSNYVDPIPSDPGSSSYRYKSGAGGSTYCLRAIMENNGSGNSCPQSECSGAGYNSARYCVASP